MTKAQVRALVLTGLIVVAVIATACRPRDEKNIEPSFPSLSPGPMYTVILPDFSVGN